MDALKHHVQEFAQRGADELQKRQKDAIVKIMKSIHDLNSNACPAAVSSWKSEYQEPIHSWAPDHFRFGSLHLKNGSEEVLGDLDIPLLLPTNVNAIVTELSTDSAKGSKLFQSILVRLLLSTRMEFVKVSVVDMDFGNSFPVLSSIVNPQFRGQIVYRQEDIAKLISSLAEEICDANRTFAGRYPNIEEYNASAGEMALPYHFVFIDDFPKGFTSQSAEELLRLIDNGNASRVGIRLFINYCSDVPKPRGFDMSGFQNCCSWIQKASNGSVSLENFPQKFPQNMIPALDLDLPARLADYIDFINKIKKKEVVYSLDEWIDDLKENGKVWSGNTAYGIKVPVGYLSSNQTFDFYLANDKDGSCNDFFALIAGRPGYGKTVFLNNIIVNSAMLYSPEELCFYLADFGEGASFSIYRKLPHVKSLLLANDKEYALRMLEDLVREAKRRSHLYQRAQRGTGRQITNLASYREVTGEKLPRIVFVMDEFHYLFLSLDPVTLKAKEVLCNGVRQWRKFGISIILSTQSISGVNFGDADKQITYRFALNLLDMDSRSVIRNDSAKSLVRKGQAIMNNTADGNLQMNVEFQTAYTDKFINHVEYLDNRYKSQYKSDPIRYICDSEIDVDVIDNPKLYKCVVHRSFEKNNQYCDVFVGKPDLLRDTHTRLRYQRRPHSNTLLIGDDLRTMVYNMAMQLIQLHGCSHPDSRFYVVDCQNVGNAFAGALEGMQDVCPGVHVGVASNIAEYLNECTAELERRKEESRNGNYVEPRVVLAIMNAQNCFDLKTPAGKFGVSELAGKLGTILSEGGQFGIHCILHGMLYDMIFKSGGILSNDKFSLFENLILLKGADIHNMLLAGLKVSPVEEEGKMVVLNSKIDGEDYEQCKVYSDITSRGFDGPLLKFMTNLFEEYRYK